MWRCVILLGFDVEVVDLGSSIRTFLMFGSFRCVIFVIFDLGMCDYDWWEVLRPSSVPGSHQ